MHLQYAKFVSLVLPFYGLGRIPSYPFDIHNGVSSNELHNVFFHYSPAVAAVLFPNIGYAVSHHADGDSRWVCCMSCTDTVYAETPDILIDAVEMGMAAWGGKRLTPEEAIRMARYLQPARRSIRVQQTIDGEQNVQVTVPEIVLDENGILSRAVTQEEVVA